MDDERLIDGISEVLNTASNPGVEPRHVALAIYERMIEVWWYRDDASAEDEYYWLAAEFDAMSADPTLTVGEVAYAVDDLWSWCDDNGVNIT